MPLVLNNSQKAVGALLQSDPAPDYKFRLSMDNYTLSTYRDYAKQKDATNMDAGNEESGVAYGNSDSLSFDGIDEYIDCDDSSSIFYGAENGMTVTCWLKTTDLIDTGAINIFGHGNHLTAGSNGFAVRIATSGKSFQLSSNGVVTAKGTTAINDGEWHFCVASRTATNSLIYTDSVKEYDDALTFNTVTGALLTKVAVNQSATTGFYNGNIDDFRYYNRVLTQTEIDALYALRQTGGNFIGEDGENLIGEDGENLIGELTP
jgi:hypothetical protein